MKVMARQWLIIGPWSFGEIEALPIAEYVFRLPGGSHRLIPHTRPDQGCAQLVRPWWKLPGSCRFITVNRSMKNGDYG